MENNKKTVAFVFGRMNPISTGHLKLIKALSDQPANEHLIYLSHTQDKKKNPLPYDKKIEYAKKLFEGVIPHVKVVKSEARTVLSVLADLTDKFDEAILVVGSDRVDDFDSLLHKYNGAKNKEGKVVYQYDFIDVVSAGERDPNAEGVTGMSASKLREFAKENNFEEFKKGIPTSNEALAKDIFDNVRTNLAGVKAKK